MIKKFWLMIAILILVSCNGKSNQSREDFCGEKIAFISDRDRPEGDIFLINPDGSNLEKIDTSSTLGKFFSISWSPNCTQILVTANENGNSFGFRRIVVNADDSDTILFTDDEVDAISWSPDGKKILLSENGNIFIVNTDGSEKKLLTDFEVKYQIFYFISQAWGFDAVEYDQLSDEKKKSLDEEIEIISMHPDWSPNGDQIAFTAGFASGDGGFIHFDIYIVDSDGSGIRPLFTYQPDLNTQNYENNHPYNANIYPRWSPDGKQIIFCNSFTHRINLAYIDKSKELRLLLEDKNELYYYEISPDWLNIAYSTGDGMFISSLESNIRTQLRDDFATSFAWSPDGKTLSFIDSNNLYLIDHDGSNLAMLDKFKESISEDSRFTASESWSPTGNQIVYSNGKDIFVINSDGSGLFELVKDFGNSINPIWTPLMGKSGSSQP